MGEMYNPVGDAIAWAENTARANTERLASRIDELEHRVWLLESKLSLLLHESVHDYE